MKKINFKSFLFLSGICLLSIPSNLLATPITVQCVKAKNCDAATFENFVRDVLNKEQSISNLVAGVARKHAEDSNNDDSEGNVRSYFYIKKDKVNSIFMNELRGRFLLAAHGKTPATLITSAGPQRDTFFIKMEVTVDPGEHLLAHITSGDGHHLGVGNGGATNKIAVWIEVPGVKNDRDLIEATHSTAKTTFPRS